MLNRILLVVLCISLGSFSTFAMDPPKKDNAPKSAKRKRKDNSEDNHKPKRIKTENNYASIFSVYEIDSSISNADLIQNALDPQKKAYRHALFYRLYAGLIPVLEISYEDLNKVVSWVRISKKMSDLDLFGWTLLSSHRYFAAKVGNRKKEVIHATKELSEILENKLQSSPNDFFYSLCLGLLRINPGKSQERVSYVRLAAKNGNGFAAFVIAEVLKKASQHQKNSENVDSEREDYLRMASKSGYLYANYILGQEFLAEGDYNGALYYFKRGAKKKQIHCMNMWNNPAYKFSILDGKSKNNASALFDKAQALLLVNSSSAIYEEAQRLLMRAAALGNTDAAFLLAQMYLSHPAAGDEEKLLAPELFEEAAVAGHVGAASMLAERAFLNVDFDTALKYYQSWLLIPNYEGPAILAFQTPFFQKAMALYEGALNKDPVASKDFALLILNQPEGAFKKPTLDIALHFLTFAYENYHCLESALNLGMIYCNTNNLQYDRRRAKELLMDAAAEMSPFRDFALIQIALITLSEGEIEEALRLVRQTGSDTWLQNPVFHKLEEIMALPPAEKFHLLGIIFMGGNLKTQVLGNYNDDLLFKNIVISAPKSIELLEKALGLMISEPLLLERYGDELLNQLFQSYTSPGSQNPEKAKALLESFASVGHARALFLLGGAYVGRQFNNLSITAIDPALASTYFHQAAAKNNPCALRNLFQAYLLGSAHANIQPDIFEALKYGVLWYKNLSVALQIEPTNKNNFKRCLFNVFSCPKATNMNALLTDDHCNIVDSFLLEDDGAGPLEQLDNLNGAFTFFSAMFNESGCKNSFCAPRSCYGAEVCMTIADITNDFSAFLKSLNENITKPGFLITNVTPKTSQILDKLQANPELFAVNKTQLLFKEQLNPLLIRLNMLSVLLEELEQKNAFVLNLLNKFGDNEQVIKTMLEGFSMMPDTKTYDYAQSILNTVFTNTNKDWPKSERLEWVKKQLKEMQSYCGKDVVSMLKVLLDQALLIIKDTEEYRNRRFKEANPFLFNQ